MKDHYKTKEACSLPLYPHWYPPLAPFRVVRKNQIVIDLSVAGTIADSIHAVRKTCSSENDRPEQ